MSIVISVDKNRSRVCENGGSVQEAGRREGNFLRRRRRNRKKRTERNIAHRRPRTHAASHFFLPSWDIRHFGQVPRRGETTSSDSRVITSDIGRKAARTRSDEHRNLTQWVPLGPRRFH